MVWAAKTQITDKHQQYRYFALPWHFPHAELRLRSYFFTTLYSSPAFRVSITLLAPLYFCAINLSGTLLQSCAYHLTRIPPRPSALRNLHVILSTILTSHLPKQQPGYHHYNPILLVPILLVLTRYFFFFSSFVTLSHLPRIMGVSITIPALYTDSE